MAEDALHVTAQHLAPQLDRPFPHRPPHLDIDRIEERPPPGRVLLGRVHGAPARLSSLHVSKAIRALLETDCDWAVIVEIPTACARLFRALFALWEQVDA